MEGQKEHRQIRLSPYFRPAPEPRGFHARRLTRHHFLSNRWGLGQHRAPGPPAFLPEMPQARSGLRPIFQGTQAAQTREIIQSTLDSGFGILRDEIRTVDRSIQQLGKDISNQFAQGLERLLESRLGPACAERVGREENEHRKNLQLEHQLEIDNLKREGELARQKLKEAEKDLEIANMQTQAAIGDLVRLQRIMDAQPNRAENDGKREYVEKNIMTEFLRLRSSVRDLAESPLLQLGRLSDTTAAGGDRLLFSPQAWNRASTRQRQYRVMTAVFQLLFRRILRPGLRMFGVQVFLRSKEHQTISASEAHLRSLERELEANQGQSS
ncbi:uncharacterized protein P884DRAFT_210930 [Thermothelomyces heterothallicus CBS 202.75]|uniref:uncharacterized protein n=1 Tax=Thermothelomyces heterothallicus CBS 202.75 TaxID=1149848 RepID=UPI003743B85E